MTKYRVRGTLVDGDRFEFVIEADDPWHVLARAYRRVPRPERVTSLSVTSVASGKSR